MNKREERVFAREIERLRRKGTMPTLDELCAAVLDARKKYMLKIRRARREAK
jgi:hypothetical protein